MRYCGAVRVGRDSVCVQFWALVRPWIVFAGSGVFNCQRGALIICRGEMIMMMMAPSCYDDDDDAHCGYIDAHFEYF